MRKPGSSGLDTNEVGSLTIGGYFWDDECYVHELHRWYTVICLCVYIYIKVYMYIYMCIRIYL